MLIDVISLTKKHLKLPKHVSSCACSCLPPSSPLLSSPFLNCMAAQLVANHDSSLQDTFWTLNHMCLLPACRTPPPSSVTTRPMRPSRNQMGRQQALSQ